MKTLFRTLLLLTLIVWLGAELFFPVVAAVTFGQLAPDPHAAGQIVGALLRILHTIGMASGVVLLALLGLAPAWGVYRARTVLASLGLVVLMLGVTAYSQFNIIPAMERDRIATGGIVDNAPADHPARIDFKRLHRRSETLEEVVVVLGLIVVALVANAETTAANRI